MEALVIVLALLLAGLGGWPVAAAVLRSAGTVSSADTLEDDPQADEAKPEAAARPAGAETRTVEEGITPAEARSILRGGLLIGILERLGVAAAILAGESVAIAYIIAIKGLGRYPELRQTPAASERFIIGTLASLLWAAAVTVPVRIWFW